MVGSNNIGTQLLKDEGERRAKEEDGSSSDGTLVSSVGAGGDNFGCTEAEGAVGVTGKGSSSLSW